MSAAGPSQGARPPGEAARSDARGGHTSTRDFDTSVYRSAHLLDLLRAAHRQLADDVMQRAARITGTGVQHGSILAALEEAIETTRQLALDHCQAPASAGPYLRQRIAAGWEHAPQPTRKAGATAPSQVGVTVPL